MTDFSELIAATLPGLKLDEGFRSHAYPDPLSGAEPWTVGFGATGPDIGPDTVWTVEEAEADLSDRLQSLAAELFAAIPWISTLAIARQSVLLQMSYNLGLHGLLAFKNTLAYVQQGAWAMAKQAMLNSRWGQELPNRSHRLATQMFTGVSAV